MCLDSRGNQLAYRLLQRERRNLCQRFTGDLQELLSMSFHDGSNERLFAREVLVKRADAHAGLLGDTVGAGFVETFPDQNASGRFNQGIDQRA